jgi:DNA modification methylase
VVELLWHGKRRDNIFADTSYAELPLDVVETVDDGLPVAPSPDLADPAAPAPWRNRLILGDANLVLPSLRSEFLRRVDLIYVDPPFYTGGDFSVSIAVPPVDESPGQRATRIDMPAYDDTWSPSPEDRCRGVTSRDKYLQWFADTAVLLRDLLTDTGLLFVHLDDNVAHEAKVVLDEVFGVGHFRGEIIWQLGTGAKSRKFFSIQHNIILVYSAGDAWTYDCDAKIAREPFAEGSLGTHFRRADEDGRRYRIRTVNGKHYKYYADEGRAIGSVWTDISSMTANSPIIAEGTGYPTQKPEKLLERIVGVCSKPNDIVLDCFCGSGTTPVVAGRLGRRWIACDASRFAVHTTHKRLLRASTVAPFVVHSLGERREPAEAVSINRGDFSTRTEIAARTVSVELSDFLMPPGDFSQQVRPLVRHFSQWVDTWAIDWDYRGRPFHNQWRALRTRRAPRLTLSTSHVYEEPGRYQIGVKVVDIFGSEMTKTISVTVE